MGKLTARKSTTARPGRHSDGGGLILAVSPTGRSRKWIFRYQIRLQRRDMPFGNFEDVSYRDERNPARRRGHLDHLLANPSKLMAVRHHPALPWDEVPTLVRRLRAETSTAWALEWLVLTAARPGEVLGARWSEIDLAGAVWAVPAERMKAAKAHRVPLSRRGLEILAELPRIAGNDHLFPGGGRLGGLPLNSLRLLLQELGYGPVDGRAPVTPHGFRSSFRDWAGETRSHPREVVETALAHVRGDQTEAAYARGDLFLERHVLMEDWAAFVDHVPATVTALPLREAV